MRKPTTRMARIDFLVKKRGSGFIIGFERLTDKSVKAFFDTVYFSLKDAPDFDYASVTAGPTCKKCGVDIIVDYRCACGVNECEL